MKIHIRTHETERRISVLPELGVTISTEMTIRVLSPSTLAIEDIEAYVDEVAIVDPDSYHAIEDDEILGDFCEPSREELVQAVVVYLCDLGFMIDVPVVKPAPPWRPGEDDYSVAPPEEERDALLADVDVESEEPWPREHRRE